MHRRLYKRGCGEILGWYPDPLKHDYVVVKKRQWLNKTIVFETQVCVRFYLWALMKKEQAHIIPQIVPFLKEYIKRFHRRQHERAKDYYKTKVELNYDWRFCVIDTDVYLLGRLEAIENA